MPSPSAAQLTLAAEKLLFDISTNAPASRLLNHFSTTHNVVLQHSFSTCATPQAYRFTGLTAVRSYFDLLATHYERACVGQQIALVSEAGGRVIVDGSTKWTWKRSRREWQEDYRVYVDFDAALKVVSYVVVTTSPEGTCVMRAVDPGEVNKKKLFDVLGEFRVLLVALSLTDRDG